MKNKLISPEHLIATNSSDVEIEQNAALFKLFEKCPIPDAEKLMSLSLFLNRQHLSRIIFLDEIYRKIINIHGVIFEFGVRWGSNLALLSMLRGIYEPFNLYRKIVGFDTFEGFPSVSRIDGNDIMIKKGSHSVTADYEIFLEKLMDYHERNSPINHIKKFELVKGDATQTLPKYLRDHPETIVSLAYFDFDIYEPTKICLKAIARYMTKGTVIAFDELSYPRFPGETVALREVLGLSKFKICRGPNSGSVSYLVID